MVFVFFKYLLFVFFPFSPYFQYLLLNFPTQPSYKPDELNSLMRDFVKQIPQLKQDLHPVEFAARLHEGLVTIHPFVDGNEDTKT